MQGRQVVNAEQNVRKPRVLHVLTSDVSTRLMRGQLRYLQSHGYEVYLACSPGNDFEEFIRNEGIHGIPIEIQREIAPLKDFVSLVKLFFAIRRIQPDICNVGTPKAGLIGSVAAWLARVPFRVYTLRGLRWETVTGLKKRALMVADRIASQCSHRVICVSHNLRSAVVASRIVSSDHSTVLGNGSSNGVEQERFAPTPQRMQKAAQLRSEYGIDPDSPVLGFVGRFTRDKGIDELYVAHKMLQRDFPDTRLVLVGDFEEGDPISESLRHGIKSDPSIILPGFLKDPSPWYHVFDVLALPSRREGFPNVVLEAQAAAKPAVGALATGTADAILDGLTGFLVPVNAPGALAERIAILFRDPALRAKMGSTASDRVREKFNPPIIWEALAQEYRRALRDRGLQVPAMSGRAAGVPIKSAERLS